MPLKLAKFCRKCNKVYSRFITIDREDGVKELIEAPDLCEDCSKKENSEVKND